MEYIGIVKSIKPIGYADVYNMEVENHHNFSVNGGFIVHNCRYGVLSRPPISKKTGPVFPPGTPESEKEAILANMEFAKQYEKWREEG